MARLTITCATCKSVWRVQRSSKAVTYGPPSYCMTCGNPTVSITQDSDLDCDEVLAESFNLSITNFNKLYELWQLNFTDKYPHMVDFVAKVKENTARKKNAATTTDGSESSSDDVGVSA